MALMLRFLGIPARVAAGFTSGKREDGGWTVTDHNAHAWVEVWFPDYGWLAVRPDAGARHARRRTTAPRRPGSTPATPPTRSAGRGGAQTRAAPASSTGFLLKERLAERQAAPARARTTAAGELWLAARRLVLPPAARSASPSSSGAGSAT